MTKAQKKIPNTAKKSKLDLTSAQKFAKHVHQHPLHKHSNIQNMHKKSSPCESKNDARHTAKMPSSLDIARLDFASVNTVIIDAYHSGQRIDNFLLSQLKSLPKSHVYKIISDGQVRLNKKRVKAHTKLTKNDLLRLPPIRLTQKSTPIISDLFAKSLLERTIFENDAFLVINKPDNLAVHGGSGQDFGLIEALRIAYKKNYLELVHRIDKATSGAVMISKKRSALKKLQDFFRQKSIQKYYLCIASGHMSSQTITKNLLRYEIGGERRVRVCQSGKPSVTKIFALRQFFLDNKPVTLVLAKPLTGRTHQIRVHLAHINHALVGDDKYNPQFAAPRLFLHAYALQLPHDFCSTTIVAPLPDNFLQALPLDIKTHIPNQKDLQNFV